MNEELLIKLGIRIAILAAVFGTGMYFEHGNVMAKWNAEKVVLQNAELKAVANRLAENKAAKAKYELDIQQWRVPYESAITSLASERDALESAGLWIPKPACNNGPTATGKSNASTGTNEATLRYKLPEKINKDLRVLAFDADFVSVQLEGLQRWVVKYCQAN